MSELIVIARYSPGNSKYNKEQSEIKNEDDGNKTINFCTVQKMLNKFLTCDRIVTKEEKRLKYTEKELAELLNITPKALKRLRLPYHYKAMVSRINLPLIHLYCSTKWADAQCKINNGF